MLTMNGYRTRQTRSPRGRAEPLAPLEPPTAEELAEREAQLEGWRERARVLLALKGIVCGTAPDVKREPLPATPAPAVVHCPGCSKTLFAPAAWAGGLMRCGGCGKVCRVPESQPAPRESQAAPEPQAPLKAKVPPLPPMPAFRRGRPASAPPLDQVEVLPDVDEVQWIDTPRVVTCPRCKLRGTLAAGHAACVCPRCRWRFAA